MYLAYCANPACGRRHVSESRLADVECFDCGASLAPAPPFFGFLFGKPMPFEDKVLASFCIFVGIIALTWGAFMEGLQR